MEDHTDSSDSLGDLSILAARIPASDPGLYTPCFMSVPTHVEETSPVNMRQFVAAT